MARILSSLLRIRPRQGAAGKPRPRRRPACRPWLEGLEDRTVPSFIAPLSYDVGGGTANSVAVGDFNGDGHPDLAASHGPRQTISVLLGHGDGSFQPPQNYATRLGCRSVAVGDFNGDGHPDLATANDANDTVSVLLGNGDGSFQPAQHYAAGDNLPSVAVGDFNGDGIPDLAVANNGPNDNSTVSVLLGNGDGSFQPPQHYAAGTNPRSVGGGTSTATASPTSPSQPPAATA